MAEESTDGRPPEKSEGGLEEKEGGWREPKRDDGPSELGPNCGGPPDGDR